MTPPEDPIDIFDRQEFPDEPELPADDARPEPAASGKAKPRRLWLWALVGVAIGLVISWVVLNQGRQQQPQMPADHPPTDAALATPTPLSAEEMAGLRTILLAQARLMAEQTARESADREAGEALRRARWGGGPRAVPRPPAFDPLARARE